jgi:tetratricopeptide (TPR) repeat protein
LSQEVRSRLEAKHADGESAIREADGTGRRAEIWGDLGKPYHAFGVIDTAEACYRRARHVDVASGAALYRLGRVLAAKGDDEGAAARFEAALTIQPAATRIDCGLGQSYRNPGRMEDASREMARFGRGEVVGGDALLAELGRLTSGTGGGRLASGRAALQMVQGTGRPAP